MHALYTEIQSVPKEVQSVPKELRLPKELRTSIICNNSLNRNYIAEVALFQKKETTNRT